MFMKVNHMYILICDDLYICAEILKAVIEQTGFAARTVVFDNAENALAYIRSGARVDVCFFDILMPKLKGTELAEIIRGEGYDGAIVFLTSSNDYAAESYKVGAFSYLLKPAAPDAIIRVISEIVKVKQNADTAGLPLINRRVSRFLFFREISHIEVIQHKIFFRLLNGTELETNKSLNDLLPQLVSDSRFTQCHRSYVVNMNAVSYIQDREIILRCGGKVPISKSYPGFKKQYLRWLTQKN
jgi:DNA-binding LytR/AlgR family response regulator